MISTIIAFIIGLAIGYLCPGNVKGWFITVKGWLTKSPPTT